MVRFVIPLSSQLSGHYATLYCPVDLNEEDWAMISPQMQAWLRGTQRKKIGVDPVGRVEQK